MRKIINCREVNPNIGNNRQFIYTCKCIRILCHIGQSSGTETIWQQAYENLHGDIVPENLVYMQNLCRTTTYQPLISKIETEIKRLGESKQMFNTTQNLNSWLFLLVTEGFQKYAETFKQKMNLKNISVSDLEALMLMIEKEEEPINIDKLIDIVSLVNIGDEEELKKFLKTYAGKSLVFSQLYEEVIRVLRD